MLNENHVSWILTAILPTFAGVYALLRLPKRWRRRAGLRHLALFAILLLGGISWGAFVAWQEPTQPEQWKGTSMEAVGEVSNIYQSKSQDLLILALTRVNFGGREHSCNVRVEMRISAHAAIHLTVGEKVVLQGMLTNLNPSSSSQPKTGNAAAKPVIPFQPKTYEWLGHVVQTLPNSGSVFVRWRDAWLQQTASSKTVTSENQALAESIVFGASQLDTATKNAFLAAGLMHVLAASGANILLIEGSLERTLYPVWRRLRLPYPLWSSLLVVFAWVFCLMCGATPSITRAAAMTTVRMVGMTAGRSANMRTTVAVSACLMSALAPLSMTSPSAWLSFAATGALASQLLPTHKSVRIKVHQGGARGGAFTDIPRMRLLLQFVKILLMRCPAALWSVVRATLWIEIWVAPLTLWLFAQLTPYSLISNVVCEPLLAILLPVVVLWMVVCNGMHAIPNAHPMVSVLGVVVNWLLRVLMRIVNTVSHFPLALIHTPNLPAWLLALYYITSALTAWILVRRFRR